VRRFFDANILVYSEDRAETSKRFLAQSLIEDAIGNDEFIVSTQVLLEFYATALRRKLMRPESALELVRVWSEHHVVANTADFMVRAFELQQAHGLSVWDALIVQAAIESRCDVLLSEDLQHGMRFGALVVNNPFLEPPAASERVAGRRITTKTSRAIR
jgi:predicted nucleic acid-binding protein